MTYAMTCNIVFAATNRRGQLVFNKVTAIEVASTFKEVTSTGKLTLPRNIKFFDKTRDFKYNIRQAFTRGDAVQVSFGYNGINIIEFTGYVTAVASSIPVVLELEDEMYNIKRLPVNYSTKSTTLQKLLEKIIPGYTIDALEEVELGGIRFANTQVGPVLEKLKQDFGLHTYWQNGAIRCGKYYADDANLPAVNFHLEKNCVSDALNYKRADELYIKIKGVSTLSNGTKITVDDIGDKDGLEHRLTYYNIKDTAKLKELCLVSYKKMKQDRFDGSFTAFGVPSVTHGMQVNLFSELYEDRAGTYYIDKVVKTLDENGIRQVITIGEKV